MSTNPFPIDPELTAIAVMYRNNAMIADAVFPRRPVGKKEFKWKQWDLAAGMTIPDTQVGRKSLPNEIEIPYTEVDSAVLDYGLDDVVPIDDIDAAPAGFSPLGSAVSWLTQLTQLDREVRCATALFNATNYATANKATLSGTSQWSHASSNPLTAILTVLDGLVMRPNILTLGQAVWTKLRTHAAILEAVKSTGGAIGNGTVTRQQVADLLEIEEILVGQAFVNTAKRGQAATFARAWGKHAALSYRDRVAAEAGQITHAFTATWGGRVAGQIAEPKIGLRGSVRVRSGESLREVITSDSLGFLWTDAVA